MLRYTLLVVLACLAGRSLAQCGACAIGDTCTVDPPFPTVCPIITPVGTVGVPYVLDVTFWIPPSFPEPTTQLNVVLDQVTATSIENVPLGLTYEASSPNFTFYPQQNPFGCIRVCGIPLVAVSDTLRVHATAQGTVGGINTTQNVDLKIPIQVLPADGSNIGFTPMLDTACAPQTITFIPQLQAPGYASSFDWDFGNGNSYVGPDPPPQTFDLPGLHIVTLATTITAPTLTQLTVSEVNEDWCGDLDEVSLPFVGCTGQPDLYFTLIDSQLRAYRSATVNNTQSHTWSGLSVPLVSPPYILRVFDQDGISDDDLLGTFTVGVALGSTPFSQGGTSGQSLVQTQTIATFTNSDSLFLHPSPNTALDYNMTAGALCAADMGLVSYTWSLNGELVAGEEGPCVLASNGTWSVFGTNEFGCSSSSSYQVIGLGMSEAADVNSLDLFPTPNDGRFRLRLSGWTPGRRIQLDVLDAAGRIVFAERLASLSGEFQHLVDFGDVGAGAYLLRLTDGPLMVVRPFLVSPH